MCAWSVGTPGRPVWQASECNISHSRVVPDTICTPVVGYGQQDSQLVVAVGRDHALLGLGEQRMVFSREGVDGRDLFAGLLDADQRRDPVARHQVEHDDHYALGAREVREVVAPHLIGQQPHPVGPRLFRDRLAGRTRNVSPSRLSTRQNVDSDACTRSSREPRCASLR